MLRLLSGAPSRRILFTFALALGLPFISTASTWASGGCPNEQFRTGLGANLPDCRAYEQVSPQDKNGGSVDDGLTLETEPAPQQASPDGESVVFASQTAFAALDPLTAPASSQYMATRGPSGWTTVAIDPRQDFPHGELATVKGSASESLYQGFSENLQYGYLTAIDPPLVPEAPEGHYNPYIRDSATGGYTLLAGLGPSGPPSGPGTFSANIHADFAGMSSDGKHVIFAANAALTPEAVVGKTNLYEWNEGVLELVSIDPDGESDTSGQEAEEGGSTKPERSELKFGGDVEENEQGVNWDLSGALSSDGRKAFWTAGNSPQGGNKRIFMHEVVGGGARTVEVSASQKTGAAPNPEPYAHYWTASADGSLVYFTSCEQLTNDSTAVDVQGTCYAYGHTYPTEEEGQDLYQYNTETGKLADITVDPNSGKTASVQGVIGSSEDGSYVYFVAEGVLAEGAVEGAYNVYSWHEGATSLVTTIDNREESLMWDEGVKSRTARVSPNGRYLAFESAASLVGNPTAPVSEGECYRAGTLDEDSQVERMTEQGRHCSEVFLYDAESHQLACASCSAGGPTGNSIVPDVPSPLDNTWEGWEVPTYQQRYLLDDGRLFFDSTAALVPQDTNDAEDVYEYEPAQTGSCTGSKACVSLISGGTGAQGSSFVDSDDVGNNVFFVTHDKLVGGDGDEAGDLYDARVDGGFEAQAAPPPCSGEACRPAVSVAPSIYGAPTSQAFSGAGNSHVSERAAKAKAKAKKVKKRVIKRKGKRRRKPGKAKKSAVRGAHGRRGVGRGK